MGNEHLDIMSGTIYPRIPKYREDEITTEEYMGKNEKFQKNVRRLYFDTLAGISTSFAETQGWIYSRVLIVAKAGGDYTTISAALSAIKDAETTKRYCILVYPGDYDEHVTCKRWVDIIGISKHSCRIVRTSGVCITAALDCTVENLTIISTDSVLTSGIIVNAVLEWAISFVMRNCYIERQGSRDWGLVLIGTGNSNRGLSLDKCELYIKNTNGPAYTIQQLRSGVIQDCIITAEGNNATYAGYVMMVNGASPFTFTFIRTKFEFKKCIAHARNRCIWVTWESPNVYFYDCELISDDGWSLYNSHATTTVHLKNCYLNKPIDNNGTITYMKPSGLGILNTPTGNIVATDVQSAINELDTEKQAALVDGAHLPLSTDEQSYFVYEGSKVCLYVNGTKVRDWG